MGRTNRRRGQARLAVMPAVVEHLRRHPDGLTKEQLVNKIGKTSLPTVQRALDTLRKEYGAPIRFERSRGRWRLLDPHFGLPLEDPDPNDLRAVLLAEAMLTTLADAELRQRLRQLAEQLDQRLRQRKRNVRVPATGAVSARATAATRIETKHLAILHHAVRRHAVRMHYVKPWENELRRYTVEPWGITVVDGAFYFKGWVRERQAPRTFRLAQVGRLVALPTSRPTVPCPRPDVVWGDDRPAFGIDEDRPDTAIIHIKGPLARWVYPIQWGPAQDDRWIDEPELLERTIPYRSCREMARRILTILDGVVAIHPPALRTEVEDTVRLYLTRNQPLRDLSPPQLLRTSRLPQAQAAADTD